MRLQVQKASQAGMKYNRPKESTQGLPRDPMGVIALKKREIKLKEKLNLKAMRLISKIIDAHSHGGSRSDEIASITYLQSLPTQT